LYNQERLEAKKKVSNVPDGKAKKKVANVPDGKLKN
jgi:hypothetical protein